MDLNRAFQQFYTILDFEETRERRQRPAAALPAAERAWVLLVTTLRYISSLPYRFGDRNIASSSAFDRHFVLRVIGPVIFQRSRLMSWATVLQSLQRLQRVEGVALLVDSISSVAFQSLSTMQRAEQQAIRQILNRVLDVLLDADTLIYSAINRRQSRTICKEQLSRHLIDGYESTYLCVRSTHDQEEDYFVLVDSLLDEFNIQSCENRDFLKVIDFKSKSITASGEVSNVVLTLIAAIHKISCAAVSVEVAAAEKTDESIDSIGRLLLLEQKLRHHSVEITPPGCSSVQHNNNDKSDVDMPGLHQK
jgi:hypothetical protein